MGEGEGGGEKELVGATLISRYLGPFVNGPYILCYIGLVVAGFSLRMMTQPEGCGYKSIFV